MLLYDRLDDADLRDRCHAIRHAPRPRWEDYDGNPVRPPLVERLRRFRQRHPFGFELALWWAFGFLAGVATMALFLGVGQ